MCFYDLLLGLCLFNLVLSVVVFMCYILNYVGVLNEIKKDN